MPTIELDHISKNFGTPANAVEDLVLTIPDGDFVCLLGPSGCGKTTTLRMIAGLEMPTAGEIRVDGRVLNSARTGAFIPPEKRGMGLVFQSYALWPHMTVAQNIRFGLEMRSWAREKQNARVAELVQLLRIGGLEARYPLQLSGGQQQRVALARMLAINPDVLLLDEPLSNLDARLRLEMRAELKRLHEQIRNTIVYVTHDQLEAMTMATQVAVMCDGRLQQFAPPMEIYRRPANRFVAEFVGNPPINLFALDDSATARVVQTILPHLAPSSGVKTLGLRPEALRIFIDASAAPPQHWTHSAIVEAILPTGAEWIVRLKMDACIVFALIVEEPRFRSQDTVTVAADPKQFHLFGADGCDFKKETE
ncbi:MAG: ABC transporter ATP-binding protein [Anaerolineales bacterium]|nr:ABC transporter ATP-binding protein [Anaerolineales bacterium]